MVFRYYFLSFLFLFFGTSQVFSQTSLEERVKELPDDTVKVLYIHKLIDSLREHSSRQAFYFALEGKQLSEKLGYKKGLANMLESIGWMHYRNSDLSKALEVTTEALRVGREAGENSVVAKCLISIAAIYFDQQEFELAIVHFKEAAVIGYTISDFKTYGRSMGNIGFAFIQLEQFDSALHYSLISYKRAEENKEYYIQGFTCRNLGEIAFAQGDLQKAIEHYKKGLSIAEESNNNYLKISILYRLGKVYNRLKEPEIAIPILQEAIQIGRQHSYREELERSLRIIADSYVQLNNHSTAFAYQNEYIILHDSLVNHKKTEQLILAQTKFDSEIKQAEIELLIKDAAMQQKAYDQQKILTYFFIGCVNLLLILMFVLWYNNRRIKGAKRILQTRNREIKKQATQLEQLNATKDKLFSIISHDLRSPIGGLKGLMELISREGLTQEEFMTISQNLRRNIDSVYDDLDNLLQWAQTQLKGIRPNKDVFNFRELVIDKMHLFEEVARAKGVALMNETDEDLTVFADKNQIGLVLRNLIANAVKFSSDKGRIHIRTERTNDTVLIRVVDTGVGISAGDMTKLFNAETHFSSRGTNNEKGIGLGLILAKEFVESNGGKITVESELGKGSVFSFILKCQSEPVVKKAMIA